MSEPEFVSAVGPVAACLERLGAEYFVTGSVVSSHLGIGRATADVDVVAELRPEHAEAIESALVADFYVDRDVITDAIRRRSMFNVVHLATMIKVDVYVASTRFDRAAMGRRWTSTFTDDQDATRFALATAEDVIVHKLYWYRAGGHVSDRQWSDVLGVLRVQRGRLDLDHVRRWATELAVGDLVERALSEA